MEKGKPDPGAQIAAELAFLRFLLAGADEFYRTYREMLLNGKGHQDEPKPVEWIPLSEH